MLSRVEHEKSFITSGRDPVTIDGADSGSFLTSASIHADRRRKRLTFADIFVKKIISSPVDDSMRSG